MLERGTIVAGYRIDGVLGDGGMGMVYRATQLSLDREVALKLLSSDLGDDSGFRTRFQREGQLQAALDHEHIVPVFEAGQSEHGLFLAMRMIDGPTLKDLILAGELDPRRSLRLLAQVASALDTAHAAGLIHRDIKPQNILVDRGDHAYLADFGLIKAPDEAARLTGTGQFIGTIDYVAPEQIQGDPASAASDIYALAGVLYETLTGEVPFPRPNEAATLHSHVIAPPPVVTERRPDLPPAIDDVISRGMGKDPTSRPSSATELIMSASRALSSSSVFAAGPAGVPGAPGTAQTTVVRDRPTIAPWASTPALERAGDGAASVVAEPPAAAVEPQPVAEAGVAEPEVAEPEVAEPDVAEPEVAAVEPVAPVAEPEVVREAEPERVAEPEPEPIAVAEAPVFPAPAPVSAPAPEPEETEPEPEEPEPEGPEAEEPEAEVPEHESEPVPAAVAAPPREPEPDPVSAAEPVPVPAARRRRSPLGALVLIALLAAAGVAGYLVGHTRRHTTSVTFSNSAAINHIQLRYPSPWQLSAAPAVVPGMTFDAPLVLNRPGRAGRLIAGTASAAGGPTLLSPSFRQRVTGSLPRPDSVRLGTTKAYRYSALSVQGVDGKLDIYAAPTSAGIATIACQAPAIPDRAFDSDCARIAATLRLINATEYPLGPNPAFAGLLSATFDRLRSDIRAPQAALSAARSASTQSTAAQQLSSAYGAAAARLSGAGVPPLATAQRDAIVAALRDCARAYSAAANAARREAAVPRINATIYNIQRARAASSYRGAQKAAGAAAGALSQALRGLSSLGYTVLGQR